MFINSCLGIINPDNVVSILESQGAEAKLYGKYKFKFVDGSHAFGSEMPVDAIKLTDQTIKNKMKRIAELEEELATKQAELDKRTKAVIEQERKLLDREAKAFSDE